MAENKVKAGVGFTLGGMVLKGSHTKSSDGLTHNFILTDCKANQPVTFTGMVPSLFREGQGIVAMGRMDGNGVFQADEVLAKHDENYMPPEVTDALEKAGKLPDGRDAVKKDAVK